MHHKKQAVAVDNGNVRWGGGASRNLITESGLVVGIEGGGGGEQMQPRHPSLSPSVSMTYVGVLTRMDIKDTNAHGPVIQIRALDDDGGLSLKLSTLRATMRHLQSCLSTWWTH